MIPNKEFSALGLDEKYHRRLERQGISTVTALCAMTEQELRLLPGVGMVRAGAIATALKAKGLSLADKDQPDPVTCICPGKPVMEFLMANKTGELWECSQCARVLYRSRVSLVQTWYRAEKSLISPEVELERQFCPTCKADTIHYRNPAATETEHGEAWLCIECRLGAK